MDNSLEKLTKFTSVIMADAKSEADAIYAEIKKESQITLNKAEDEALNEAFRFIKTEMSRIQTDNGRLLSKAMMDNKRALYLRREAMADEVEAAVREKLAEYVTTTAYREQMVDMAQKIIDEFKADMTLYLRPEDQALQQEILALQTPHSITFMEGHFQLGGMEAACPTRKRHIDASFDTTLQDLRSHFSELFGLKLSE